MAFPLRPWAAAGDTVRACGAACGWTGRRDRRPAASSRSAADRLTEQAWPRHGQEEAVSSQHSEEGGPGRPAARALRRKHEGRLAPPECSLSQPPRLCSPVGLAWGDRRTFWADPSAAPACGGRPFLRSPPTTSVLPLCQPARASAPQRQALTHVASAATGAGTPASRLAGGRGGGRTQPEDFWKFSRTWDGAGETQACLNSPADVSETHSLQMEAVTAV